MAPDQRHHPGSGFDRIEWFTVSYRSIGLVALAILAVALGGWFFFRTPAPPPAQQTDIETGARFAHIEGSVQVKRSGTLEWRPADLSMVLKQNDLVKTGAGGAAEIHFADDTVFSVRPDSLITIEESSQNPISRLQKVSLSIRSGEANFQTAPRTVPGSTTISTPTVTTTAQRDTTGSIQVAQTGESNFRIFSGAGEAQTRSGQKVALGSNEGLRVDARGAAGPKVALPNVPTLTAPSNMAELAYPKLQDGITLLLWNAVPGSSSYRVIIDFTPTFARPLYDRQGQRATQMELHGLEAGSYFWKVAAIDASGVEGRFSEPWRFVLSQAPVGAPPPLSIETLELKGNVLHVRGRTEAGATLVCNGERLEVLPDGTFNEFLTFEGGAGASVLLSSTGTRGGVAEARRRVTAVN